MINKRGKSAFTLLEFVLYLALFSLQSIFVFQFVTWVQVGIKKNTQHADESVRRWLLFDTIRRDIMGASQLAHEWVTGSNIWTHSRINEKNEVVRTCIEWCIDEGTVQRLEGEYDFINRRWIKKTVSTLYKNATSLVCMPIIDSQTGKILKVKVDFKTDQKDEEGRGVTFYVALRNGQA